MLAVCRIRVGKGNEGRPFFYLLISYVYLRVRRVEVWPFPYQSAIVVFFFLSGKFEVKRSRLQARRGRSVVLVRRIFGVLGLLMVLGEVKEEN